MINDAKRECKINMGPLHILIWCVSDPTTNDQRSEARVQNKRGNHKVCCVGVNRTQRVKIHEAEREYKINVGTIKYLALVSLEHNDQWSTKEQREYTKNCGSIKYLLWWISGPTTNDPRSRARIQNKRANHKAFCAGVCRNHRTMINEAHREYVLSAPLGRKKSTETDKKKSRDQRKNGLDPKTGFDPPKSFDLGRFSPDKIYYSFSVFFVPFATHPSAPALSVLLALSSILCALSRWVLSVPLSLCSDGLIEFVWRGSLLF